MLGLIFEKAHGIGPDGGDQRQPPITIDDALRDVPAALADVVITNPPFGEGGAGETVRRNLLRECEVHTLLRLPTGIFYAQGVKANVLFFDCKPGAKEPWTRTVWAYDLRTNKHFTSTSPSRPGAWPAPTSTSSSPATGCAPAKRGRPRGRSKHLTAAGDPARTTRSSAATR